MKKLLNEIKSFNYFNLNYFIYIYTYIKLIKNILFKMDIRYFIYGQHWNILYSFLNTTYKFYVKFEILSYKE